MANPNEGERQAREAVHGEEGTGKMTVSQAGHIGGQRVRELIQEGKEAESQQGEEGGESESRHRR